MEYGEEKHISFGAIVATIGSILIGLGVAWLLALNWHDIPSAFKIVILVLFTAAAYIAGTILRIHDYAKIGESLLFLGALLYTLSIFLIAQIFNLAVSFQAYSYLLLLSWVGIVIAAYIFGSPTSLWLGLIEFLPWVSLQFVAFYEKNLFDFEGFAPGILAIIYLVIGVFLYGLTQVHKSTGHAFFDVYRYWTAFYILLLTYIFSFQILLPYLWPEGFELTMGVLIFLIVISVIALISAFVGISMSVSANKLSGKEVLSFVAILIIYVLLISSAGLVSGAEGGFSGGLDVGLFILWLFDNILFIIVILSVIGYGVRYKSSKLVNLGILFFVVDIITRYIGFWMDIGGEVGFAVMSIIGGIILIIGGWLIESWRKRLVEKTQQRQQTGYAIY
ncbi:MAG: DUF2157 domain-containing protein [Nanoarchaeota archaeon]